MDFEPSERSQALRARVRAFVDDHVLPAEQEAIAALDREVAHGVPYPAVLVDLRARARSQGLWNLFMPEARDSLGLSAAEYAPVCEEMGRSTFVAPMAFNCAAPDSGNAELLAEQGTGAQRERWLGPLAIAAVAELARCRIRRSQQAR